MGIEALYFQIQSVVRVGGSISTAFDVNIGVKQGCPASPCVFCLFLDRMRDFLAAHAPPSWHAHTPFLAFLAMFTLLYMDNLVLIADSAEGPQ